MTDAEIIEAMARAMFDAVAEREKSLTRWDAAEPDARLLALFCARAAFAICAPAIRAQAMEEAAKKDAALNEVKDWILYELPRGTPRTIHHLRVIDAALAPPAVVSPYDESIRVGEKDEEQRLAILRGSLTPPAVAEKGSK